MGQVQSARAMEGALIAHENTEHAENQLRQLEARPCHCQRTHITRLWHQRQTDGGSVAQQTPTAAGRHQR